MVRPRARPALTACLAVATGAAWLIADRGVAHAYTVASAISSGCHEQITTDALRAVRLDLATAAPIAADGNERALIDDLEFSPASDLRDLGGATLLIGVRDNDLKGRTSNDITQLALVHGDPQLQREHCLRSADDDEPVGSGAAVAACQAFILERIAQALDGLDASGTPDAANRTVLSVFLALRHRVDAPLPTYYLRVGQAIHAIEDSFTHTFRTADGMRITTVLNWIDEANGTLVADRDGPPHASELDRCDNPDDLRRGKRQLATDAATAILRATLDPASDKAAKMTAAAAVVDQYLGYQPGCTFDNDWCQAPERAYANGSALGCSVGGPASPAAASAWAILAGLMLLGRAGRPRRSAGRRRGALLGLAAAVGVELIAGGVASRAAAGAGQGSSASAAPDATEKQAAAAAAGPASHAWGGYVGGSGSVNYGGLAAAAGARLRFRKYWTFGLDAEWNPWFAINGASTVRAGAFNGYATGIVRVPLVNERFDLRTTVNLGTSTLLIDLYGAPKGSTGVFFGINPLGIEWALSKNLFLIFDPLGYALPIPHLTGVPFAFPQYRATVGLELYRG